MNRGEEHRSMPLGEHLEELRRRLIVGLVGPVVAAVGMLFVAEDVVAIISRPLLYELAKQGLPPRMVVQTVGSAFAVYLKVAILGGLVIGIPWLLWQMWQFITPGLYRHEKRLVVLMMPGSAALAAAGVAFMYYVMLPLTLWFFIGFTQLFSMPELPPISAEVPQVMPGRLVVPVYPVDPVDPVEGQVWINASQGQMKAMVGDRVLGSRLAASSMIEPMFALDQYVSFVLWLGLCFALAFQLPLVMVLLGMTGLVDRRALARGRKYAVLVAFVAGAVLTPGGDPVSQTVTAAPLYLLYELGLLLMWWFGKPRKLILDDE